MWMDLLIEAVKKPSSKKAVADRLGISRSQVSRVISGTYGASTEHIAKKVLHVYGQIHCPHLSEQITQAQCKSYREGSAPTSSPRAMKHWRACQRCNQNTEQGANHDNQ